MHVRSPQELGARSNPGPLPEAPEDFALRVRVFAGPADGQGEESFDLTVCSPEWLLRHAVGSASMTRDTTLSSTLTSSISTS